MLHHEQTISGKEMHPVIYTVKMKLFIIIIIIIIIISFVNRHG